MNAVDYWMGELANRSDGTREKYRSFLVRFCEWVGKTPDQLIEQRKVDVRMDDPKEQRRIESSLKGFIAYLDKGGNSVSTQQVAYAAIRSFFEMHFQPLRMRRGDYPVGESLGSRAATKEDIKKLMENASLRIKAMILFLKDTGLRVSDVVKLQYGDLAKEFEDGHDFISLSLITKKNKTVAKTFVGPDTVQALKEYFKQRQEGTRKIPPETIKSNSPLFRIRAPKVKPITRSGMSSTITYHANRSGVNGQFSAHSFRKFYQTQLEAAGVHPNWIDQMIGHRLINSRDSYSLPTDQQLKEAYVKAYSHLRITGDANVEARVSILESQLDERNRIIEALVANGSNKKKEIEGLRTQIAKLQARLNSYELRENQIDTLLRRIEVLEKMAQN